MADVKVNGLGSVDRLIGSSKIVLFSGLDEARTISGVWEFLVARSLNFESYLGVLQKSYDKSIMHLNPFSNLKLSFRYSFRLWIGFVLLAVTFLVGCNQQRYKPAKWRAADRNQKKEDNAEPDWGPIPSNGTLPNRSGSTLPGRGGSTLPYRGGTLPFRGAGTLPFRDENGTLPMRRGMGTLPMRRGMSTIPQLGSRIGSTLPQRSWQRDPVPRRSINTLPINKIEDSSAAAKTWSPFPDRSSLLGSDVKANQLRQKRPTSSSAVNPLR